ncbi:MAG: DUF504 domain-containing protein [archaeon]|nr:MAG: DUF504 domain-containing protein [archaeon]
MKSELVEKINKLIWTGQIQNYEFVILHRGAPNDEKLIRGKDVVKFKNRFLVLGNGTKIPTHRIKRIVRKV